ncbi:hypothetical protein KDA_44680 [Dictyobacter alpinus]|uniref:Uncharacterized protein n=1 Tax=Dictyobacter alpinus TaxID=2014873 RepID=A0A402BCC0_9CHLR|nr:hypothetical protein KDA_44680 [Dictyobacter alpinus]
MRLDQRLNMFKKHRMPVAPTSIRVYDPVRTGIDSTGTSHSKTYLRFYLTSNMIGVGATALRVFLERWPT